MGTQIENLLHQKMDRKQFLKNVGAGLTAVVGLGMIARAFQQPQTASSEQQGKTMGYGASTYGGAPKVGAQPSQAPKVMG